MKVANRIFTERELSQVEVVAHLLGYPTEFVSNSTWTFLNVSSLYRYVFRGSRGLLQEVRVITTRPNSTEAWTRVRNKADLANAGRPSSTCQGDDSDIPVPAIFMFLPGSRDNKNTHQGLKLFNVPAIWH